ncbi:MAG: hypothetical protein WCK35_29090 [Chloroflexota bacterium]
MKFGKKFFLVLGLVALLTAAFASTAFAADTRVVRYASVVKVKVLDDQPATFRLLGNYTCDRVQINSSVSGKVITINAFDAKIKYTGKGCGTIKSFRKDISVGTLVPGIYTIVINPDQNGKGAKVIKRFIAPMIPTPQPTAAPAK